MKILALDLSTSVGWAFFDKRKLEDYDFFKIDVVEWKSDIRSYKDYPGTYPQNFIEAAEEIAEKLVRLDLHFGPDLILIEETNQSRQRFSNKILEFIHFAANKALPKEKVNYITQMCWRASVGAYATKEDKKLNAKISRLKKKMKERGEKGPIKIDGKVVGRRTTKHHSIRVVKEEFGIDLMMKENDVADAICIGLAGTRLFKEKP